MAPKPKDPNRTFNHIASTIKIARAAGTDGNPVMSQTELSEKLGYKNGQFISNVERGLCSIPPKQIKAAAKALEIDPSVIKNAILMDYDEYLTESCS